MNGLETLAVGYRFGNTSPIVITKSGLPVAALVPYSHAPKTKRGLAGSVLKESGDPCGTGEKWDADLS
jgi:antitoxin (DNA-binding transcriptional repressor) of toxin-antitoxin stability system